MEDVRSQTTSSSLLFQVSFHFYRGHAAGSGSADCLTIAPVLHITARKDSGNSRKNVLLCLEISVSIGLQVAAEHLSVGDVANTQEQCTRGEIRNRVGFQVPQLQPGHFLLVDVIDVLD